MTTLINPRKSVARALLFQFSLKVVFDQVEQVDAVGAPGYAVGFAGIHHEAKLLACLDERVGHLDTVLEMHVVVTGAVRQEQ